MRFGWAVGVAWWKVWQLLKASFGPGLGVWSGVCSVDFSALGDVRESGVLGFVGGFRPSQSPWERLAAAIGLRRHPLVLPSRLQIAPTVARLSQAAPERPRTHPAREGVLGQQTAQGGFERGDQAGLR